MADRSAARVNLVPFCIFFSLRKQLRFLAIEPFLTLGKASLQVFCTHIAFVFIGLAFLVRDVGDDVDAPLEQLHGLTAIVLLAVTFTALILVAVHQVRKRRGRRTPARSAVDGPSENAEVRRTSRLSIFPSLPTHCPPRP